MSGRPTRIVLVDDHVLVRSGMKALLDAQPDLEVTGEAGNGAEGVELALAAPSRRGADGPRDARARRDRGDAGGSSPRARSARILVVTSHDDDKLVLRALRAGATGFFLKDAAADRLAEAVRAVAPRATRCSRRRSRRRLVESQLGAPGARLALRPRFDPLTERERDIVRRLARGLSNAALAQRARAERGDDQDPRHAAADQARRPQPRPGRRARLRERLRPPRPYRGHGALGDPGGLALARLGLPSRPSTR